MLLSWTMLALGAISFASCGDDDDDDKGSSSNSSSIVKKYEGKSGASIDGDDVVYVLGNEITVFHFSGDKIESATSYINYQNETLAKAAYEEGKKANPDLKIDGTVVYSSMDEDEFQNAKGFTKEQYCKLLNEDYSDLYKDYGGF